VRGMRLAVALLAATLLFSFAPAAPAEASTGMPAEAKKVITFARGQIGKPYRSLASGLDRYDCVGLTWRAFRIHDLAATYIGGRRTPSGYYNWFANRGQITRNPRPGDLVVWGKPPTHVGIYTGTKDGHPMAVSALVSGVKEHRVHGVTTPFRAYLRVAFNGKP
jgi:peptidoglycan DL-endopeptidase CwlO